MNKAYTIKIQLIPTNKKYKSALLSGLVFATDQATAVNIAMDKVKEVVTAGDNPAEHKPKLFSITKINAEFILYEPEAETVEEEIPFE